MTFDEFWRATPRLLVIAWSAYQRRRGFAAWHASAAAHGGKASIEDMMGLQARSGSGRVQAKRQPFELMLHNLRVAVAASNRKGETDGK